MAERGALSLLCLLCLTFLHTAAKHVDKGKGFLRTACSPVLFVIPAPRPKEANEVEFAPQHGLGAEILYHLHNFQSSAVLP